MSAACLACDLLMETPDLAPGQRSRCPRCGEGMGFRTVNGLFAPLSWALAGLVLLALSGAFPFLVMKSGVVHNAMTIPGTLRALFDEGYPGLAVMVFVGIVGAPGLLALSIVALLTPLTLGISNGAIRFLGRLVFSLSPWSMAEVFVIGVIVSLVKLIHLASVSVGISFWAYVAFAICLTAALATLDRREVWEEIERWAA